MIDRALLYLLLCRLKNSLLALRKRPGRLMATLLLLGLFAASILLRGNVGPTDLSGRVAAIVWILGLYFLLSLVAGLGEPGPVFQQADLDFVLPAPFRRRHLLVYHLLGHYAQMMMLALLYSVILGAAEFPNPVLALVAVWVCLVLCTHLQTAGMLVSGRVSESVFGRLRWVSRFLLVGLLAAGVLLGVGALSGVGELGHWLQSSLAAPAIRVFLYPAVAVAEVATATTPWHVVVPFASLLALAAGSFAVVLLFPVDFVETAATRSERKRRAGVGVAPTRALGTSPTVFRGAAAVVWLNALTLRRRLRIVVGAIVMLLFVMLISGVRHPRPGEHDVPQVVVLLGLLPLIANLPLGFKGHKDVLELLKTLPAKPSHLALAEVVLPAFLLWVLQVSLLLVFLLAGRIEPVWFLLGAAFFPLLDVAAVAIGDLFQLGRDRQTLGLFLVTAQMFVIGVSVAPALLAGALLLGLTGSLVGGILAGWAVELGVDGILIGLLGRRFDRFETGELP